MRTRLGAIAIAIIAMTTLVVQGASAAAMDVTMSPRSGPNGTEVTASSSDTCPEPPEPEEDNVTHHGPVVVQQVKPAAEPTPEDDDEGWDYIQGSDGTAEEADTPWEGTFVVGGTGDLALAPGPYKVYFACGYSREVEPPPGLPRTDGPPLAYGDYTPRAFEVCPDGTQTCNPNSSTTTTTTTATTTTTSPSTSTTAPVTTTTARPGSTTTVVASNVPSTRPGGVVEVTAIGYKPNSTGTIDFNSTPVRVGTFTANSAGNVAVDVRIPRNATTGLHHIVLTGVDPNGAARVLSVPINIAGIVRTGASSDQWFIGAAIVLLIGVALRLRAGDLRRARGAHMA